MPVPAVGCIEFASGFGESGLHSAGTGMPVPYGVLTALPARNWLRQFGTSGRPSPTHAPPSVFVGNGYHPFRNAGTAFPRTAPSMVFAGAAIFREEVPFPPGAYSFCLSKKSRQKNDTKGRRLEFAPANTCTVRVAAKHLRCTLFAQTQAAAQPLRSLDSATGGAPLRPPLIPLPHYSLFLRIWVALPTQGDSAGATVARHLAQQRGRTGFLS